MTVEINLWAVLVAAVINMVVGSLWYGPLFGKIWMPLAGHTPTSIDQSTQKGMGPTYFMAFVGSVVMAYVFAHVLATYGADSIALGLQAALWMWFGFISVVLLGKVLWEGKSWKLWLLESAYYLVVLMINSAVLVSWR